MSRIVQLQQNSPEWLAWRRNGIGGSDAPVIAGASPWKTPLELWREKLGLVGPQEDNERMARGRDLEPVARAAYEAETGYVLQPVCLEHEQYPWRRFSVDGAAFDLKHGVEIKCPGRGDHIQALEGRIPDHYWPQVVRAFAFGFETFDYYSFDGQQGVIVPVRRDDEYLEWLFGKERDFWQCVLDRKPPEQPVYAGEVEITAPEAVEIARKLSEMRLALARAKQADARLSNELLKYCTGAVNKIGPMVVARVKGRMTLDQKAAEKAGLDLEPFRKQGEPYWRITEGEPK